MKRLLISIITIVVIGFTSKAQYVTIPDTNLRQWFQMHYPGCMNASQQFDTTCATNVTYLYCEASPTNWDGFQYFRNLQKMEFDGSGNVLPALPATITDLSVSYTAVTALPALPPNLVRLTIVSTYITSLPALPSTLLYLNCHQNNQLLSFAPLPNSIVHLEIADETALTTIPAFPSAVKYLNVSQNPQVTSLPALPPSLDTLMADNGGMLGGLTSMPALPSTLKILSCKNNQLTSLPALPSTLQYLNAEFNQLTSLPAVSGTVLTTLSVYENDITTIPALPSTLTSLNVSYNSIGTLPALPAGLQVLNCWNCELTSLPALPSTLLTLDYNGNHVNTFPSIPSTLRFLNCNSNQISTIPSFPDSLRNLYCGNNQLTSLPALPHYLQSFSCSSNQLTSLPAFPSTLTSISCEANHITCLPVLPPIDVDNWISLNIAVDDVVTCFPNIPPGPMSVQFYGPDGFPSQNPPPLQLCNPTNNIYHCASFPLMRGHVYYDNNNNGVQDTGEPNRANVKVQLSDGSYTFTNNTGYYQVPASDTGTYSLTIAAAPTYFTTIPSQYNFHFSSFDTLVINDFGFQATATRDSVGISINPLNAAARPGFPYPVQIVYSNDGTTTLNTSIVFNYDNTRLTYDSCSNTSVVNTGSSLTLSETGLVPGMQKNFIGYFSVNTTAVIGDSLRSGAHITSAAAAAHDSDVVAIRGSYDPNDKSATPKLTPAQVSNGDYIYYTIRFQNTGTDTAFNIVVTDTLDNKLQPSTMQMIATSHPCITTVKDNKISFEFINILLPDSNVNQLKSHGYISFRIKPVNTLVVNDIVPNKAAIYFDYNSPVVTNSAVTTIVDPVVLPLKLVSFTVSRGVGLNANLYWQTNDEVNVRNYIIEMSTNGRTFTAIGSETAKGYQYNSYTKTIAIPSNVVLYFRLKIIDVDGRYSYSGIAILKNDKVNDAFGFLNNPVQNELIISLLDESLRNTTATIFNAQGVKVKTILLQHDVENVNIKSLSAGIYHLVTLKGSRQFVIL